MEQQMFDKIFEDNGVLKHPRDRLKLKLERNRGNQTQINEEDLQFDKQYEYLKQTREFKSRPPNVNQHELADKLVAL